MLVTIAALTSTTYVLIDTKRGLPKNPCSIAAFASLVADSQWLGIIRVRTEELERRDGKILTEMELEKEVMKGLELSMGWWRDPCHGRFGIDVGKPLWTKENLNHLRLEVRRRIDLRLCFLRIKL